MRVAVSALLMLSFVDPSKAMVNLFDPDETPLPVVGKSPCLEIDDPDVVK